jgi:hypothetical protein
MIGRDLFLAASTGGLGLLLLGYTAHLHRRAARTRAWPATAGRLRSVRVARTYSQWGPSGYRGKVEFEYVVDGRSYVGRHWTTGFADFDSEAAAERAAAALGTERPLVVYYDPADPADAVLEPGVAPSAMRFAGATVALLAIALACLARAAVASGR